jgi:hypothetical protein
MLLDLLKDNLDTELSYGYTTICEIALEEQISTVI